MKNRFLVLAALLTVLGVSAFALTGADSPTALIPSMFGLSIGALMFFAGRSPHPQRWIIAAATVTMLGLAGSLGGLAQLPGLIAGEDVARPAAVAAQATMALLCIGFLIPGIARLSSGRFPLRSSEADR